jgi:hypothetical protein
MLEEAKKKRKDKMTEEEKPLYKHILMLKNEISTEEKEREAVETSSRNCLRDALTEVTHFTFVMMCCVLLCCVVSCHIAFF